MKRSIYIACLLFPPLLFSQTFSGNTGAIPDNQSTIDFNLTVSGVSNSAMNGTFGLESVCLNITHNWDPDLDVKLVSPDGTVIDLFNGVGNEDDDNFTNTCFSQSATINIIDGTAPFTGNFKPQTDLGIINNGQNPNGIWKLRIRDVFSTDAGTLLSWNITLGGSSPVFSSNLPIIIINTSGTEIPDEPKLMSDFKIINNATGRNYLAGPYEYEGKIGIEQRGSSSSQWDKKSYGFETWDNSGVSIDTMLLGMPSESDWILSANHSDKSLMNNMLSYQVYNEFGHYAPRTKHCEVFLNGEYRGVYVFMEKIKRDKNRVSISKLTTTDNTGVDVTGGYIVKIDKTTGGGGGGWNSPVISSHGNLINYQYEYPKSDVITSEQSTYIKNFIDEFENNLNGPGYADPVNGYRKYIKLRGFLDYFILNETSRNVDGYRLSTFLYKEKITDGNKLSLVPWDYDIAWRNADYCNGSELVGWAYQFNSFCSDHANHIPFWWYKFLEDPAFQNDLKCRYEYLRSTSLSTARLHAIVDSAAAVLDEGQERNFLKYPVLGEWVWPNPTPVPVDYAGEVTELKNWITNRLAWLDANMPGTCTVSSINDESKSETISSATASPNPFENTTMLSWNSTRIEDLDIMIVNSTGEIILQKKIHTHAGENLFSVDMEDATPGIYIVHLHNGSLTESVKIICNNH